MPVIILNVKDFKPNVQTLNFDDFYKSICSTYNIKTTFIIIYNKNENIYKIYIK